MCLLNIAHVTSFCVTTKRKMMLSALEKHQTVFRRDDGTTLGTEIHQANWNGEMAFGRKPSGAESGIVA